jgi:hypothetical protein
VPVLEGQVSFVPQSTVRVEGKDATSVVRLIEALEELDDVQSVYANYDIPTRFSRPSRPHSLKVLGVDPGWSAPATA